MIFIFKLLCLFSIDCLLGFSLYLVWKYLDLKYFSESEIVKLKEENEYLRRENQKINGTSANFWEG